MLPWSNVLRSNRASFTLSALASCRDCGSIHPADRQNSLLFYESDGGSLELRYDLLSGKRKTENQRAREFNVWLDTEFSFFFLWSTDETHNFQFDSGHAHITDDQAKGRNCNPIYLPTLVRIRKLTDSVFIMVIYTRELCLCCLLSLSLWLLSLLSHLPHPDRVVNTARHHCAPVGRYCHGSHLICVPLECVLEPCAPQIPNPNGIVIAA